MAESQGSKSPTSAAIGDKAKGAKMNFQTDKDGNIKKVHEHSGSCEDSKHGLVRNGKKGKTAVKKGEQETEEFNDEKNCLICASEIKYFAIGHCNHKFCHMCSLRMRALFKNNQCPICKSEQPKVVYAKNLDFSFEKFKLEEMHWDTKLEIYFQSEEAKETTLAMLRYNCPAIDCDFFSTSGQQTIKAHVTKVHHKHLCTICVQNKKSFYHEHVLYDAKELKDHTDRGYIKSRSPTTDDGFRGHPYCKFCNQNFFDNDALFDHLRKKHETCFVCKRQDPKNNEYYKDYKALEVHFEKVHYLCKEKECLEHKFVVFDNRIELQAHELEQHSYKFHGSKLRQARQIEVDFNYGNSEFQPTTSRSRKPKKNTENESSNSSGAQSSSLDSSSNRRLNAPSGFGMVSSQDIEEPVEPESSLPQAPLPRPNVVQLNSSGPRSDSEFWPTLNGEAPSIPTPIVRLKNKGPRAQELWPELPGGPKPTPGPSVKLPVKPSKPKQPKAAGSSKSAKLANVKQGGYAEQLRDKRPPLERAPDNFGQLPPPLPTMSSQNPNTPLHIPLVIMDQISTLLQKDKAKIDAFIANAEVLYYKGIKPAQFVSTLRSLVRTKPSDTTKSCQVKVGNVVTLLSEVLDKGLSRQLQTVVYDLQRKEVAFPQLPTSPKNKTQTIEDGPRRVLVIKGPGSVNFSPKKSNTTLRPSTSSLSTPRASPAHTPDPSLFPSLASPTPLASASKADRKVKGKKVDWTQL